jgi:hypothetical protein
MHVLIVTFPCFRLKEPGLRLFTGVKQLAHLLSFSRADFAIFSEGTSGLWLSSESRWTVVRHFFLCLPDKTAGPECRALCWIVGHSIGC